MNGIEDPLDPRVVDAYWVGNELLDRVRPQDLARHVRTRFHGRLGRSEERVLDSVARGAIPHHCFHVFAVYPWLGLLRSGVVDQSLHVLDQCRTTAATVERIEGDQARVRLRPLVWDGTLRLGDWTSRTVRWRDSGRSFIRQLEPGDLVSLHWDFVCDRLTPQAAARLDRVTRRSLTAVATHGATGAPAFA